jgi:hypothetical protein
VNDLCKFDIFLSHSTRTNTADAEDRVLMVYSTLKIRKFRVFFDRLSGMGDGRVLTVLEQALSRVE